MVLPRLALGQVSHLEQLVLKSHVILRLKANTGTEDVGESRTLLGESVDDRSTCRGERSLVSVSISLSQPAVHHIP
jgi:hypothetical protein